MARQTTKKFNLASKTRRSPPSTATSGVSSKANIQVNENLFLSPENHEKLLQYIKKRLEFAESGRWTRIHRFERIDQDLAGFVKLNKEDRKRALENVLGHSPTTTDFKMELHWAQLDDFLTYLLSVLIPDEGFYSTVSPAQEQDISNAFTAVMDKHATWFKHYPELAKGMFDMLKYNFGGWAPIEWRTVKGNKIERQPSGETIIKNETVREGNSITAIDPYNFLYDISVNPTDLNARGEFFAIPDLVTPFRIRKMAQDQEIYSINRFINDENKTLVINNVSTQGSEPYYYRVKPDVEYAPQSGSNENSDWFSILGGYNVSPEVGGKFELTFMYIKLIPKDFKLNEGDKYEIWRIGLVSNLYIVSAERLNNAHGMIPCAIGMPRYDGFGTRTKTFAETLQPLNMFASNEMNVRQKSARKALYGVTLYNKREAPLMEKADVLGGKVPWNPVSPNSNIQNAFMQLNDTPKTDDTLQNIEATIDLMEKMIPIDILRQVANLERATAFQAAATVQGANRRPFKYAKIINTQAMSDLKLIQGFNVFQFQNTVDVYDARQGQFVEIDPTTFGQEDIESLVAKGLKGIDKLIYMELIRDIINMMLQSQVAQQQVDVVQIIDYWSNLAGEEVNFDQFKFKSQIDALPVEQRDAAFQLLQQALSTPQGQVVQGAAQANGAGQNPALTPPSGIVDPGVGL